MRKTYTVGGMTFSMRTFTGRDVVRVTGKLAVLPMGDGQSLSPQRSNEIADGLLAICSIAPKIVLDDPVEIPEGTLPVSEIPDAVYMELVTQLSSDSGFSAEAAAEVRPTVAIAEPS